eukprot:119136_1
MAMKYSKAKPITAEPQAGEAETLVHKPTIKPAPKLPERKGCCAPCEWFQESPLHRWQFGLFLLFAILPFLFAGIRYGGNKTIIGDVISGLFAVILAVHGANHFRILLGLKEEVDKFAHNNKDFKEQNIQLAMEVNRLERAIDELKNVEQSLTETSNAFQKNVVKFRNVQETLSKLADNNIEGVQRLKEMSHMVQTSIQNELVQHERSILMKVRYNLGFQQDKKGLTKKEYETFVQNLPGSFQIRFRNMNKSWKELAGEDGLLNHQEFSDLCDKFAQQEASAGGTTIDPLRMSKLEPFDCNKCTQ